ncbi:hypothetical protein FQR65_LT17082 [Abscondita terminalis]|nr:hypothetical protein FQR65_LT17082 [Abscondita terminalis]
MADKHVISFTMAAVLLKDAINQLQRGDNSYKSGYVKNMLFNKEVKPALLKGTVTIDVEDEVILHATCICPRGLVKCHHMVSLCIYAHHNVSITDQECAWAAPSKSVDDEIKTIRDLYPQKRLYTAVCGEVPNNNVENFLNKLGPANVVGYSWLLRPQPTIDVDDILPSIENIIFSKEYFEASHQRNFITEKCCLSQEQIKEVEGVHEVLEDSVMLLSPATSSNASTSTNSNTSRSAKRKRHVQDNIFEDMSGAVRTLTDAISKRSEKMHRQSHQSKDAAFANVVMAKLDQMSEEEILKVIFDAIKRH